MIMKNLLKPAAVAFTFVLAMVTGLLYITGVSDDIRDQNELNQRLKTLCNQARNSKLTDNQRTTFLKSIAKRLIINHCTLAFTSQL